MGLSGGAIAGIVIGACAVLVAGIVVMFWAFPTGGKRDGSKSRKDVESNKPEEGAGEKSLKKKASSKIQRMLSVSDGHDHFFSNLIPSFIRRDKN
jgi:hypothetical protein